MVKEHTQYSRLLRAEATQQRVGQVTFVMWLKDVESVFTELQAEDYITFGGKRYDVVTSTVEDTSFVVTATEYSR
jgi:hypothetical protein